MDIGEDGSSNTESLVISEMDSENCFFQERLDYFKKLFNKTSLQNRLRNSKNKKNPTDELVDIYQVIKVRDKDVDSMMKISEFILKKNKQMIGKIESLDNDNDALTDAVSSMTNRIDWL